ncbi:sulfur carrier protein ThiS [Herbaspirillum sp. RTI4]|uniref:sulfur carrier protein ThiS n=1 Tax=Herbaspirillum sp. RTI4 TaxID=3048640 RepID=UPI002AB41692|nr:sulfur carrier protein ThiS [Herbaspirillum sp. RTI4]MDY7577557.1 sulfur carrier protein ThiS [Herbaspirillum sp. RTI4]MEA9981032.1 sulfur carrier protein ThiS [Herbaspirillum sp. RTI4]
MQIVLNGAAHTLADDASLNDLMATLSLGNQAVAVAVNRQVVRRQAWETCVLRAGDTVDVVRAIGGG